MRYAATVERLRGLGSAKWAVHFRARAMRAAGEEVLLLSIGQPDFDTPPAIAEVAIESIRAGRTRYASGRGERVVLEAIAAKYRKRTGREIGIEQVIYLPGSQPALFLATIGLAGQGDEVLVPEPYYATYDGVIALTGARQVPVPLRPEDGFHLRPEALAAAITPASRVLLLNSPHNPTGAALNRDEIAAIGELAIEHDLWIVSDEVYEDLVYDREFASPFDDEGLAERTVVISSLSKSHAMPGFRSGWVVGPAEFSANLLPISESMLFGSQPFIQDAAVAALTGDFEEVERMRQAFRRRSRLVAGLIGQEGPIRCRPPDAGIFVMVDVRPTGLSGDEFAHRLLDETGVAVMPGESFGPHGAGHLRVSITAADEVLEEACTRMLRFAADLRRRRQ